MKLPNARWAIVDKEKITEFLLSTTSPRGRIKARFSFGSGLKLSVGETLQMHFGPMALSTKL